MAHTDLTTNESFFEQLKEMLSEGKWYFLCVAVFAVPIFQFAFQMLEVASSRDLVAYVERSQAASWETNFFIVKQAVVIASLVGVYVFACQGSRKVMGAVWQVFLAATISLFFLLVFEKVLLTGLIDAIEAGM